MFRFSLVFAALLYADVALAGPATVAAISAFVASISISTIAINIAISLALSFIVSALTRRARPRAPELKRDLQTPRSRPPKRFVYGRNRVYGTPAPWRVKGSVLYGCLILNSRPSEGGTIQIAMDKRPCTVTTGDIHDFSGNGAVLGDIEGFPTFGATDLNNPRVWIGLGDQTTPPDLFVTEAPDLFKATDGWRGCTVMWVRLEVGSNEARSDRWRAVPPEFEVEMDWSLVYDPRDENQDADDPATWTFSNNQALVLMDALRMNPLRQYPLSQIHLPSFIEAADVADEQVERYYASLDAGESITESRYTANGILIWNTNELLEQIEPVVLAGGGDLVRIGGLLGYAAAKYRPPLITITDIVEDGGIDYQVLRPGREVSSSVLCAYISPERDWQEAELERVVVAGASTVGGNDAGAYEMTLEFVTSATQAMRLQQIMARKLAAQKTLGVTLWPEALDVVGGATIAMNLPEGFERLNGEWMVTSANPAVWLAEIADDGEQRLALRIPVTLRQTSESIYEWVPETDEQEILEVEFDPVRQVPGAPQNLTAVSGAGVSTDEAARIRVDFDAVTGMDRYEVDLRQQGQAYATVLTTTAISNILLPAISGVTYDVRVRGIGRRLSSTREGNSWVEYYTPYAEVTGGLAQPATSTLPLPTNGSATGGTNEIAVTFTAPNSAFYSGMQFWGSDVDDVDQASILDTLFGAAGETKTYTETGLGNGVTRYYFARAVGPQGRASDFTASVTATTDP